MIATTDDLALILRVGGFQFSWVADVIVDGDRVLQDLPLEDVKLVSDGTAKIRNQGTCTIVYSDQLGATAVPDDITSWFTPYATFLVISYVVSLAGFSERVTRGRFKIVGVSDPQESRVTFRDQVLSIGSRLTLTLADDFAVTDRERFIAPSSPADLSSVWAEIGRISGLPLNRTVADSDINRAVTYQESRIDALFDLAAILDGLPYMNPAGLVTIQPRVWPAESEALPMGQLGRIVASEVDDLTDDGIYNQVVVRSHGDDQTMVLATAQVLTGPLRYGGPFGRVPYFAASEFITTTAQAQEYADSLLPSVSRIPAARLQIECLPDPRREVGDVVPFDRTATDRIVGRIERLELSSTGPMVLKMAIDNG